MIIITRGLSDDEELYYKDTLSFVPMHGRIATDAIAVITHNKAPDSLFSVAEIRGMLSGSSPFSYTHLTQPTKREMSLTGAPRCI